MTRCVFEYRCFLEDHFENTVTRNSKSIVISRAVFGDPPQAVQYKSLRVG
jgi:hypothetical protein